MSTRTRLTLYFTLLFGVIVVGLATASYVFVRNSLYSELDGELRVAVEGTAMSAEHELNEHNTPGLGEADLQAVLNERRDAALPDTEILVRQGSRVVAYKSTRRATVDLRTLPPDLTKAASRFRDVRIASRDLPAHKFGTSYQIYACASVIPVLEKLHRFGLALLLLVPLGLMLAAFTGYAWARNSLAPLNELLQTIEAVTTTDLSARVPVRKNDDDIAGIGQRFNSLLDRLETVFESQRRFMADASHELRTPVTVALASAQATIRDPLHAQHDSDEALRIVEQQMLRLKSIVQDLLFLSQADSCLPPLAGQEMYLDDVVADASRAAQALARVRQQRVNLATLPEARIWGNPDLLRQTVLILLDNAVKFTPPGGQIEIAILRRGSYWVCQVADNGRGIPEAAQTQIFERFYRAGDNGSPEKVSGSGLGLAVAKSIIDNHRGTLTLAESRPGLTRFEIGLKALERDETNSAEVQANSLAVKI